MDDIVEALRAQQDELTEYVARAGRDELDRPSRCEGWSVADVLLHLAQTNDMAVASVEGRLDTFFSEAADGIADTPAGTIDDWAGALVDKERGDPVETRDRWQLSADAQVHAFTRCAPGDRLQWVMGDMAARSLATTRLTETWIHTVDVAVAFGPEPPPTGRLWHTARLVWRTVPYALSRAGLEPTGPVVFDLDAPDGTTWSFGRDSADPAADDVTVVRGSAHDLCTVAGQRGSAAGTSLAATGPDAEPVLRLMRTFA